MSHDRHVTRELLAAILDGQASPRLLGEFVQHHLMDLCPECRCEIEAFRRTQRERLRGRGFEMAERVERARVAAAAQVKAARWLVRHLQHLSPAARLEAVRREPHRYASPVFVNLLLDEGLASLPADPPAAQAWAETANLALTLDPDPRPELLVRTAAHLANARRALGELRRAADGFLRVRQLQRALDVQDVQVLAETARLEASLHTDLRQFRRAEGLLQEALAYYRRSGQLPEVARLLIKRSHLHSQSQELERAAEAAWQAMEVADQSGDPRLYAYARFNLACLLADEGKHQDARDLLASEDELFATHLDPLSHLRLTWLEARIEAALGDAAAAEAFFLGARDGFAEQEQGFDSALVCLDLAVLYHRLGRWEDLEEVCVEAVTLFEAHAVHRDALAALILLRDAVVAQKAELAAIEEVASYLKEAQHEPGRRTHGPS